MTGVATTVSHQNAANAVAVVTPQSHEVPAPTIENAIQGKVPGALIQQNNGGAPGGGMQIQIRGITSINANAVAALCGRRRDRRQRDQRARHQRDHQSGGSSGRGRRAQTRGPRRRTALPTSIPTTSRVSRCSRAPRPPPSTDPRRRPASSSSRRRKARPASRMELVAAGRPLRG